MTINEFWNNHNSIICNKPFIVIGFLVVKLDNNVFAKCDYVNPLNHNDFLIESKFSAEQTYNWLNDELLHRRTVEKQIISNEEYKKYGSLESILLSNGTD